MSRDSTGAVMKFALCVFLLTLQYVVTINYITESANYDDWICDHELDLMNDIKVSTPKRSVDDENKGNNIWFEYNRFLLLKSSYRVADDKLAKVKENRERIEIGVK